jgi:two-component sensor histidine kinase
MPQSSYSSHEGFVALARRIWQPSVILWPVIALLFAFNLHFALGAPWAVALPMSAILWLPWCLLAPMVLSWLRMLHLESSWSYRDAMSLVFGMGGTCVIYSFLSTTAITLISDTLTAMPPPPFATGPEPLPGTSFLTDLVRQAMIACPVYLGITGIGSLSIAKQRILEREHRALEEAAELSKAKIEMLYAQLRPHFLFNALNTIAAQVHSAPDAVEKVVTALGELLRQTLESEARSEVSLRRELELVEQYFSIERARFGDGLHLRITSPSECMDAIVPALILQPLVENAVRHGLGPKKGRGQVSILAERIQRAGRLCITVHDDGVGLRSDFCDGIGLCNTKARLRVLYGTAASAVVVPDGISGAMSVVELPWKTQPQ